MKLASNIAGVLLGLIFNMVALNFFFHFFEMRAPPADSPPAMFLGAMILTGYFAFVKVLEIDTNTPTPPTPPPPTPPPA